MISKSNVKFWDGRWHHCTQPKTMTLRFATSNEHETDKLLKDKISTTAAPVSGML